MSLREGLFTIAFLVQRWKIFIEGEEGVERRTGKLFWTSQGPPSVAAGVRKASPYPSPSLQMTPLLQDPRKLEKVSKHARHNGELEFVSIETEPSSDSAVYKSTY